MKDLESAPPALGERAGRGFAPTRLNVAGM
jgi:hypothetical protein